VLQAQKLKQCVVRITESVAYRKESAENETPGGQWLLRAEHWLVVKRTGFSAICAKECCLAAA